MPFDMSRCPQNDAEARDWFFQGIGKQIGQPADDWEQVMENCGLPPGYGPNVIPNASMPFFAFTQQYSGGPKGRAFEPADRPDDLNYWTVCMQYLDNAAQTYSRRKNPKEQFSAKSGLVWAWYKVAGHNYKPVQSATGGGTQPVQGLTEDQVIALINKHAVVIGSKIALRTNSGLLAGIKGGGPTMGDDPIHWIGKEGEPHAWESLEVVKGE